MMVDRPPIVDASVLKEDLEEATTKIEEMREKSPSLSQQEINDLIHVVNRFNQKLNDVFWEEKKLVPAHLEEGIEKALAAIKLFPFIRSADKEKAGQRNVDQAIASLTSALAAALNTFDQNLRDLKKLKIGHRVEKTHKGKST